MRQLAASILRSCWPTGSAWSGDGIGCNPAPEGWHNALSNAGVPACRSVQFLVQLGFGQRKIMCFCKPSVLLGQAKMIHARRVKTAHPSVSYDLPIWQEAIGTADGTLDVILNKQGSL